MAGGGSARLVKNRKIKRFVFFRFDDIDRSGELMTSFQRSAHTAPLREQIAVCYLITNTIAPLFHAPQLESVKLLANDISLERNCDGNSRKKIDLSRRSCGEYPMAFYWRR